MASKKISEAIEITSLQSTDVIPVGRPLTGEAYKVSVGTLLASAGAGGGGGGGGGGPVLIEDVIGLQTALNSKVNTVAGKALSTEDYTTTEKTKLTGLNTPASGNASASELVKGNDTRLTDARTPTAHTTASHSDWPSSVSMTEVGYLDTVSSNIQTQLNAKAASTHNHDSSYAPISKGVTNGDSHDHNGGDGGQIAYTSLSGTPVVPVYKAIVEGTYQPVAGQIFVGTVDPGGAVGANDIWVDTSSEITEGGATISPASSVVSETSFGQSSAVGTGTAYARSDHTHGTPTAPTADQILPSQTGNNGKVLGTNGSTASWVDSATGTQSFKTITVSGQSDVVADSATDTLTLSAGTGISITTNASTDTVTITATGAATPGAHATSHVTGGSDTIANAVAGGNSGLMSGSDKTKLDSITSTLRGYVFPEDYGTIGGGDDSVAINAALAASKKVLLNGTYHITNPIVVPAGATLEGSSILNGGSIIYSNVSGDYSIKSLGQTKGAGNSVLTNITLKNFALIKEGGAATSGIKWVAVANSRIDGVKIKGMNGGPSLHFVQVWDSWIDNGYDHSNSSSGPATLIEYGDTDNSNNIRFRGWTWETFSNTALEVRAGTGANAIYEINLLDGSKMESGASSSPFILVTSGVLTSSSISNAFIGNINDTWNGYMVSATGAGYMAEVDFTAVYFFSRYASPSSGFVYLKDSSNVLFDKVKFYNTGGFTTTPVIVDSNSNKFSSINCIVNGNEHVDVFTGTNTLAGTNVSKRMRVNNLYNGTNNYFEIAPYNDERIDIKTKDGSNLVIASGKVGVKMTPSAFDFEVNGTAQGKQWSAKTTSGTTFLGERSSSPSNQKIWDIYQTDNQWQLRFLSDDYASGGVAMRLDRSAYTPTSVAFPFMTSNGFLKTSGGNGAVSVDTTSYLPTSSVVNDLTTGGTNVPLSAEQGKTLQTNKLESSWTGSFNISTLGTITNAQFKTFSETTYAGGTLTGNRTISLSDGPTQTYTLGGANIVFTLPAANALSGNSWSIIVELTCDGSARSFTWSGVDKWINTDGGINTSKKALYEIFSTGGTRYGMQIYKEA